ncbi:CLUMA_CG001221, isoform A [Clunio marinus]|uniref:CLUMA_CG001221, isoform A n=1 Tax=Clunio marinus TaxID=568069 RepID=A0A1J1HHQ2_9DIPT|nr:CLUMA_CG001221, isoform A [Clunio marinus]
MLKKLVLLTFIGFVASQGVLDTRCPLDNNPPTRLPHDTDCTLFYVCNFGSRFLMPPCPAPMQFDTPSSSCRTPPVVCGPIDIPTVPPPPTAPPTLPPTIPPTDPPTQPPTVPPTVPPTEPPTVPPTVPPTDAPTDPPTDVPATAPPVVPTVPNEIPTVPTGASFLFFR